LAASKAAIVRWVEASDLTPEHGLPDSTELRAWNKVGAIGAIEILREPALGLFCSIRCPRNLILETYDLARALRDAGVPVVSGFHTPMEKECLDLLLRGNQPIVACPARSIEGMRLPAALKRAVEAGRLLLLSAFKPRDRRPTAKLAEERNRFVAALATEVFVAFAAEGGKTEQLCRDLIAAGKAVLTFDSPANAKLIGMGAIPMKPGEVVHSWNQSGRRVSPNSEPSSHVL
jgi:predicted Rossmann fold nucleotide-binding protein DprA/Smf involved in DNA uptake